MAEKFDVAGLNENSDNPLEVFRAQALPQWNRLYDLAEAYKAMSDTGDAVADFLKNTDNKKVAELVAKRDEYTAAIEKINASLNAIANEHIAATIGNGQSPDSIKKDAQDEGASLREKVNAVKPFYVMMGHVKEVKEAAAEGKRPRAQYVSNGTPLGNEFVQLLSQPSLSVSGGASDGKGKLVREWWKTADTEALGLPDYKAVGKIPATVWEAYDKANA